LFKYYIFRLKDKIPLETPQKKTSSSPQNMKVSKKFQKKIQEGRF